METQQHVQLTTVAIAVAWATLFNVGSYQILRKRDLL